MRVLIVLGLLLSVTTVFPTNGGAIRVDPATKTQGNGATGKSAKRHSRRNEVVTSENKIPPFIKSPLPHETLSINVLPRDFQWSNANGRNWLTPIQNQHIPVYCGSCWAMAATSALSDRINIIRKEVFPEIMVSVQSIVYCVSTGCGGGNSTEAYEYMRVAGAPTQSCQNYIAEGDGDQCTAFNRCRNCDPEKDGEPCYAVEDYPNYYVAEHGIVFGVEEMKAEIYSRGPIACYINSGPIYYWGLGDGANKVFTDGADTEGIDHVISVVGFGYDPDQDIDYWTIRNSWGSFWGEEGFFRLKMGDNQLNIESTGCAWAVPANV